MSVHLRNIESGEIKVVDPDSDEFANLRQERTDNGLFPLWEQTSAGDADPENHAAQEEIDARSQHLRKGVTLADVTADGVAQSRKALETLESDSAGAGDSKRSPATSKPSSS